MDWQTVMNNVIDYIEDNLEDEISLETAAKIAGYSTWEFQRMFSFVAHTSFGDYVRRRKMTSAAEDILLRNDKIIDIALKYGYDSPASFTRAFNRTFGTTPSSVRKSKFHLKQYPKITFPIYNNERVNIMNQKNDMQNFSERGYYVKENAPVYFTPDIEKTSAWFRDILGWYGDICGEGYGCVFDYPGELIVAGLTPFRGIHLFHGEPSIGVVGFINVQGLEKLRQMVIDNGWNQISDITPQHWGANECSVTTIDGSILRFFELNA